MQAECIYAVLCCNIRQGGALAFLWCILKVFPKTQVGARVMLQLEQVPMFDEKQSRLPGTDPLSFQVLK